MGSVQTILTPAGEKLAVLPAADYQSLLDEIEAAHAVNAAGAVRRGEVETFSADEARAYAAAATPLAFWRQKRGMTQSDLAKAVGISQSYVAGLEAGDRKGDPGLFLKLARALSTTMEMLVDG